MQRTISSKQTFVMKFLSPIWILFFSAMIGRSFFETGFILDPPTIVFSLVMFGLFVFVIWYHFRFKKVGLLRDSLLVSNHFKQIIIPFSEISHITENVWNNIHPVTIHLKNHTEFGNKIVFMPTYRFFSFWTSHPIVQELNNLVRKNKYNSSLDAWN